MIFHPGWCPDGPECRFHALFFFTRFSHKKSYNFTRERKAGKGTRPKAQKTPEKRLAGSGNPFEETRTWQKDRHWVPRRLNNHAFRVEGVAHSPKTTFSRPGGYEKASRSAGMHAQADPIPMYWKISETGRSRSDPGRFRVHQKTERRSVGPVFCEGF